MDLKLIAMFQDIKSRFAEAGTELYDKFIVKGFSAGECLPIALLCYIPSMYLQLWGEGGNMYSPILPLKT